MLWLAMLAKSESGDLSGASTGICTGKLPWEYSQGSGVNLLVRDVDGNPIA